MKTKITHVAHNVATITYEGDCGELVERELFAPHGGGYVRQRTADGRNPQACERLYSTGSTLTWSGEGDLVDIIRREWRSRRAAERRDERGWASR